MVPIGALTMGLFLFARSSLNAGRGSCDRWSATTAHHAA